MKISDIETSTRSRSRRFGDYGTLDLKLESSGRRDTPQRGAAVVARGALLQWAVMVLFLVSGLGSQAVFAFTCTTNNVNGNWNAPATWSGCGGGIPGAADDAVIANFNRTYTVTANASAASLTFTGGNQDTVLEIDSGVLLTINGNAIVNAPTGGVNKEILVLPGGRLIIAGSLTLNGGTGGNNARLEIDDDPASEVTIGGNINVNNPRAQVRFGGEGTLRIGGHFANGGTFRRRQGTVVYNGAANQNVGDYTYYNMTINKTGGVANLTGSSTVTNVVTFTQGNIVTGANTLVTSANCATSVARTSGHVVGNLRKLIPNNASNCTFEIGDNANYTPVVAQFLAGTNNGNVTASTFTPDHPTLGTSGLDTTKSVNRYWTLINDVAGNPVGLPAAGFSVTFNFVAGDVDVGANTTLFEVERYAAPNWFPHTVGARTATSTQATGIPGFGDFAVGERLSGYNPNLGRFNAFETSTPAGALRGIIKTKIAGAAASIDIIHLNNNRTALQNLSGSVANRTVRVELMNAINNGGALDANNCRNTWTVLQTLAPNPVFANNTSRLTVTFNQPNSWSDVRVRITYLGGGPVQIGCSTDRFAIRPNALANVNASDSNWTSAGTTRPLANTVAAGGNVHRAGQPFTLRATAQNAASVTTTNYSGSPTVRTLTCTLPAVCANGMLLPGVWSAALGIVTTSTADYSEVGAFNLTLEDQTFAAVDSADSTLLERTIAQPAAVPVGRFVPDHFLVATNNTPVFRTFNAADAACSAGPAPRRTFTYIGQPFGYVTLPQALVTAQNATNATTTNYRNNLWKISTATPSDVTQTYVNPGKLLNTTLVGAPTVLANNNGTGTVTPSAADVINYVRNATTPETLFTANLSLTLTVVDDSEAGLNQGTITTTPPGAEFNAILFDSGDTFRYGRLWMANAYGSEKRNLSVNYETQFWNSNGNAFIRNMDDNCTALTVANFGLGNYQGGVTPGSTTVSLGIPAFSAGSGTVTLSAPSTNAAGSVDMVAKLESGLGTTMCPTWTPAPVYPPGTHFVAPYLQGKWCGANYDKDPVIRATFGIFGDSTKKGPIYLRENF